MECKNPDCHKEANESGYCPECEYERYVAI